MRFVLSGDNSPKILESFTEVVTIAGFPVLPIHAILLHKLLTWPPPEGPEVGKGADFIQMCINAVDSVHLNDLSPLWQSNRVMHGIHQHILIKPTAKGQWAALVRGVDSGMSQFL